MFPPFCDCGGSGSTADGLRRHQQRKLTMLRFWRDGLERQLAAVEAAISTLQQQIQRDAAGEPTP
jgi:hypothetical protein